MKKIMLFAVVLAIPVLFLLSCDKPSPTAPITTAATATPILTNMPNITATAQTQATQTPTSQPQNTAIMTPKPIFTNTFTPTPSPVPTSIYTPAPTCQPVNAIYTSVPYTTDLAWGGNYIITSESAYLTNYAGLAALGTPTPTPVPVDFNTQMLVGLSVALACAEPEWNGVTGITNNCDTVTISTHYTYTNCNGANCNAIADGIEWYVMNKTSLPIEVQESTVSCQGVTTTSTTAINATILN